MSDVQLDRGVGYNGRSACKNNGQVRELVWPSGKAGKQKDLGSIPLRLSSIFKKLWFVDTAS